MEFEGKTIADRYAFHKFYLMGENGPLFRGYDKKLKMDVLIKLCEDQESIKQEKLIYKNLFEIGKSLQNGKQKVNIPFAHSVTFGEALMEYTAFSKNAKNTKSFLN